MTSSMTLSFQGSFDLDDLTGTPVIPVGQEAIVASAGELGVGRDTVSFRLAVSYKLSEAFTRCFAELSHALTLFVDDPFAGRTAAIRLEDPTMIFEPMPSPSFLASRGAAHRADVRIGGQLSTNVEITGFARRHPPTLYARVALQAHISPVLELRFADRTVGVYLQGRPHALELHRPSAR
ncbi:MAG: hypothetical protein R3B70_04005 [Polyangiaceae bacterium]